METVWINTSLENVMEPRWSMMLIVSLSLHLGLFSLICLVPEHMPTKNARGIVYEVNLVEIPRGNHPLFQDDSKAKNGKKASDTTRGKPAKLIRKPTKKERPVVIAKRTLTSKKEKAGKIEVSSSKLVEQALSRAERKLKEEKKDPIAQAISRLKTKIKAGSGQFSGGDTGSGIEFRIYQIEIENRIKSNWSYPVALARGRKNLEATVVVSVKQDGTILKSRIKKRSYNVVFDQSVSKAVERSNPLPPFPEGYRKTRDEIEINFNLRDLEGD